MLIHCDVNRFEGMPLATTSSEQAPPIICARSARLAPEKGAKPIQSFGASLALSAAEIHPGIGHGLGAVGPRGWQQVHMSAQVLPCRIVQCRVSADQVPDHVQAAMLSAPSGGSPIAR